MYITCFVALTIFTVAEIAFGTTLASFTDLFLTTDRLAYARPTLGVTFFAAFTMGAIVFVPCLVHQKMSLQR